ncbi:MAG: hypothetical protein KatS3mg077_0953 [Candidatus Binatia bacterium]|nr:MAG: hypothetical protein KatS3mg077_0953 [Candidatus Binatia bacterium]
MTLTPRAVGSATAPVTATKTATATPSPSFYTPTPAATPTNHPPLAGPLRVYSAFVGYPIEVPVEVADPDGDPLSFAATAGPSSLSLHVADSVARLFWVPGEADIGPQYARVGVWQQNAPTAPAYADFLFDVQQASACESVHCVPLQGCEAVLGSLDEPCCQGSPVWRRRLAWLPCPQGKGVWVGRNLVEGFGLLKNCDNFRVINFGQIGATVRLNLAVRCLDVSEPVIVSARMRTAQRELFDAPRVIVRFDQNEDGFARRLGLAFPVRGPGPFFEFEGAEAQLVIQARDIRGQEVNAELRLRLTFTELPDSEDLPLLYPPWDASDGVRGTVQDG